MSVAMLSGNGRWGHERQDRTEARATGQYEPVSEPEVYQSLQAPPQAEDYTIGPDGLAVRKKRGSRMLV